MFWKWLVVVHLLCRVQLFVTPWTAACQASLSFIISQSLFKLISVEWVIPSNHLILYCPLFLLPSIFPSIRVFSKESVLGIRGPKYWSFSFSISPSNKYSGLISVRIDWFDLLAVPGTLKSLLQHHSSKASVLWRSAFFMVQLSHPLHWLLGEKYMVLEVLLPAVFTLCLTSCIKVLYPLPISPNLKVIKLLRGRKVLSASVSLSFLIILFI